MSAISQQDGDYLRCSCRKCAHESRKEYLASNCSCCNLEDAYSLATLMDFKW